MLQVWPAKDRVAARAGRTLELALLAVLLTAAWPRVAYAGSRDATANRLDNAAMNEDYFATRFDAAVRKLEHALALCGRDGCSAQVRARVERDLGVVYVVGLHDTAKGVDAFKRALADDPAIELDPAFVTPEVNAAFAAARKGGQVTAAPAAAPGELQLRRVTGQRVKHPVPIYVELPEGAQPAEVRLYFKRAGQDHYRSVRMKRVGEGYGGLIPCDVVSHAGTVDYFVRALDSDDQPIAHAGSDDQPLKVDLVEELDEKAPRWPDHEPPARCEARHEPACETDSDCASGQTCSDAGRCVAHPANAAKSPLPFRISLNVEQDAAFGGGSNVCTEQSQLNDGYACFRDNGTQYHGTPIVGAADSIASGFALATTRVLVGGDYLLGDHFTVGLRLGYVLRGGGPRPDGGKSFLPFHAEARAAYFLRDGGFNAAGFNPYFFLSGGLAQVDSKQRLLVFENPNAPPPPNQIDNPPSQDLDAWRKMGTSFVAPGVGVYYALGARTGLTAELRYMALFPTSGGALSLSLGFAFAP
jgi:hypothetical protein